MSSGNLESVNLKSVNLTDSAAALPTQHLIEPRSEQLIDQSPAELRTEQLIEQQPTDLPANNQVDVLPNNGLSAGQPTRCVTCGTLSNAHVKPVTNVKTPVMPLGLTQVQVDQVIQSIIDLVGERKPTPAMVIRIVAQCLRCTKHLKLTPSLEKKLIIHTIQSYICRVDGLSQDDQDLLMVAVDTTVDEAVDTLTQFKANKKCCVIA